MATILVLILRSVGFELAKLFWLVTLLLLRPPHGCCLFTAWCIFSPEKQTRLDVDFSVRKLAIIKAGRLRFIDPKSKHQVSRRITLIKDNRQQQNQRIHTSSTSSSRFAGLLRIQRVRRRHWIGLGLPDAGAAASSHALW